MTTLMLTYQAFTHMQVFQPVNAKDDTYYMFGRMDEPPKTLLVVHAKTSKHMFCCEEHMFVYPYQNGACEMCAAAAETAPANG